MDTLPAWYPDPAEAKPAPMPLLLVQAFLNTYDPDTDVDLLADASAAQAWFVDAGLLSSDSELEPAELALARTIRDSMRSVLSPGAATDDGLMLEPLRELARTRPSRLTIDDHGVCSVENPAHECLEDGLFDLLLIIRAAQEDGSWKRLKACANEECAWVYYDRSRNQQGSWCDMAACGNRLKNRRLRARRR
jgi:predicted RNA-binding Zn ribbon-like protein